MSESLIPNFATVSERDRRFSDYVEAGGTLPDGMCCLAGGTLFRRIDGEWQELPS